MLTDPRVSACVVLYRSGDEALSAIRCLQDSEEPVDVFVVDNSPDEPTAGKIRLQFPRVRVIPMKKNVGYGRANNAVLTHLTSRYHLIMNPDVTFAPDLIRRMAAFMDAHEDIAILSPRAFNPDGSEQFLPRRRPTVRYLLGGRRAIRSVQTSEKAAAVRRRAEQTEEQARAAWASHKAGGGFRALTRGNLLELKLTFQGRHAARLDRRAAHLRAWRDEYTLADMMPSEPMEIQLATGCCMMIRTHLFYRLHGFDPRYFLYHEDSDLSLAALQHGKIVYHPDMHITHTWHRDSAHRLKALMWHLISTLRFFHKWGWRW